jgi:Tol biopolymer transport system component
VYFVAATSITSDSQLFKVAITGGTVTPLAYCYTAQVRDAGDVATFDYLNPNSTNSSVYTISTNGNGSPTLVTSDLNNYYIAPQWSKDGTKIVLASNKDDAAYEVYVTSATPGGALTQVTNLSTVNKYNGATFSADGTMIAFVGTAGSGGSLSTQGVYTSTAIGTTPGQTLIYPDSLIEGGIYWTGSNGRSRGLVGTYFARRKHHGLLP